MKKEILLVIIISSILVLALIATSIGLFIINNNQDNKKHDPADRPAEEIVCGKSGMTYCETDQDCICVDGAGCFMGNKEYYDKCEDKEMICDDYCEGWGQKDVKCIKNECKNIY
ncbi:hypothetical protein JW887_06650 [Candidatus Dojkabacteria bacterium]|nr:hypothetical protein [Candidatus Dojkabacteria bacterium]